MADSPIYISGPMTNMPEHNFPAFNDAAQRLNAAGFDVLNPADGGHGQMSWADYLRRDLRDVLNARGVAVLPGWESSKGARLEVHVAAELGLPVLPVETWLELVEKEAS